MDLNRIYYEQQGDGFVRVKRMMVSMFALLALKTLGADAGILGV